MNRTHNLTAAAIHCLVPDRSIGIYRLGQSRQGRFSPTYFGRSDTDLRRRLLQHAAAGSAPSFQFELTATIHEAFQRECTEWHLGPPDARNAIHPDRPGGLPYGCRWCIAQAMPAWASWHSSVRSPA